MKTKAPALQAGKHSVLLPLQPERVEVERGRVEELEGRRGLSAERAERGSDVRRTATPRWLWHAMAPQTGTG